MNREVFLKLLQCEVMEYNNVLSTADGDWIVKGFVDIYNNVYTMTLDTKVVSKVIEILLIPALENFAAKNNLRLELASQQNFYPDLTFISNKTNEKFAVDIKTTMKDDRGRIKSMTLGAFTGYFRNRESVKNINYPYKDYSGHFVLGVIYSQVLDSANERTKYTIGEIKEIESVIRDFTFFVQPKYKIATDRPGSGNTKNIGAVANIDDLVNGIGKFAKYGELLFDNYWMNYLTRDMAKEIDLQSPPYNSLDTYMKYKREEIEIMKPIVDRDEY